MKITEVTVSICPSSSFGLLATCSIVFDDEFILYNLKIIQKRGGVLVVMPSKKKEDKCNACNAKNHLKANYCCNCGVFIGPSELEVSDTPQRFYYCDIAHPLSSDFRSYIVDTVLKAYQAQLKKEEGIKLNP